MARTIFDKLHLTSAIDGDWRIHSLQGLSRLSPSLYFGSTQLNQVTVSGYYNCPDLAEFRVAVREIRPKPAPSPLPEEGEALATVGTELREGTPDWNKRLACPNLFDMDTRNLYFGQLNQQPQYAKLKVGQESDPAWNDPKVLSGEIDDETGKPYEPGPEGRSVKGMPVRLQQVHFQAYNPDATKCDDIDAAESGNEFAAYFLVSNPVGPIPPPVTTPALTIDSDFSLQRHGEVKYWTYNRWTYDGSEKTAKKDWTKRLVIGQEDAGTQLFDSLTEALNKGGGPASGGAEKCLPRFVTHVYATECGLKYNYVTLSKSKGKVTWTAGVEDIIDFTDCESGTCVPSDSTAMSCSLSSSSVSCSSASYSSLPSGEPVVGGGQIGCPRDYCPGMEPGA